jgi:glycosyltransferase involved in cell wall biosynthesis
MRVGIVRTTPWSVGGGFQYEVLLLDALAEIARRGRHDLVCLTSPDRYLYNLVATGAVSYAGLPMATLKEPWLDQRPPEAYLGDPALAGPQPDWFTPHLDHSLEPQLRTLGVDWIFQLSQSPFVFSTHRPFVMPIHDLQHRLQPEFPEVGSAAEIAFREYLYRNACRFATLILVDSEQGKADVLSFYGDLIDEDRIRILPFHPPLRSAAMPDEAELRRVATAYGLPERFLFYPAQFWRHKNHHLIVRALRRLLDRTGEAIPVVLCGAYTDAVRAATFIEVMNLAEELGVRGQLHYLGWVPDRDVPALYRLSAGLVMPTFFGPTNLPTLEAWHYERPVITSDIPGLREQTGDAGLLVNPRSPDQLAEAMLSLWRDEGLVAALVARGRARLATYRWESFVSRVTDVVDEASTRLREGLSPRYSSDVLFDESTRPTPLPTGARRS